MLAPPPRNPLASYRLSMVPVAASGQIAIAVVVIGAVLLLVWLLRMERTEHRNEHEREES
jgi:hypothetical protein